MLTVTMLFMFLLYRVSKVLENRQVADEERISALEKEVEQTVVFGEEADRKYEEVTPHYCEIKD